jgi:hypothetical protein
MKGQEILGTIDSTLDQLIQNAEAMSSAEKDAFDSFELDAFKKTQESLLAKLLHIDQTLQENTQLLNASSKQKPSYNIQEKLQYFQKLSSRFSSSKAKPFIRKIRKKKSLSA